MTYRLKPVDCLRRKRPLRLEFINILGYIRLKLWIIGLWLQKIWVLPFTSWIIFYWWKIRWGVDQNVGVIWLNVALDQWHFIFCADVSYNVTQPQGKISFQNTVTVFGLPYKVVLEVSDCMCPSSISFFAHFCPPLKILLEDIIHIMQACRKLFAKDISA